MVKKLATLAVLPLAVAAALAATASPAVADGPKTPQEARACAAILSQLLPGWLRPATAGAVCTIQSKGNHVVER